MGNEAGSGLELAGFFRLQFPARKLVVADCVEGVGLLVEGEFVDVHP